MSCAMACVCALHQLCMLLPSPFINFQLSGVSLVGFSCSHWLTASQPSLQASHFGMPYTSTGSKRSSSTNLQQLPKLVSRSPSTLQKSRCVILKDVTLEQHVIACRWTTHQQNCEFRTSNEVLPFSLSAHAMLDVFTREELSYEPERQCGCTAASRAQCAAVARLLLPIRSLTILLRCCSRQPEQH